MKHYTLKVLTIRHMKEDEYKQYKKWMQTYIKGIDWKELEEMGIFVERTAKPDEDVKTVYDLSITDMHDEVNTPIYMEDDKDEDFCACGNHKMPNSDFCKDCI